MSNPIVCKYHPGKPANKICWQCKLGLCKYCGHEGPEKKYYYCEDCQPEPPKRGVMQVL